MTEHEDRQFKKIILKDSSTSVNKCDEVIKWLDTNQLAEVEEFQQKQKENKNENFVFTVIFISNKTYPKHCIYLSL